MVRSRRIAVMLALAVLSSLVITDPAAAITRTASADPLTGAAERPQAGDPDGSGTATFTLIVNRRTGRVCHQLQVSGITLPATAAHIHKGSRDVAGPIVVTLRAPDASGSSDTCVRAKRAVVRAIIANPSAYYVNVHTSDFPDGALRGQLTSP